MNTRNPKQRRPIEFIRDYIQHAEGSVLVRCGQTHVICTASVSDNLPRWLRDKNQGWLSAEYGMLPRATQERNNREATRGKQQGRTQEIQRLIGRSLRNAIDLKLINGYSITIDCDVIQADGGTRTAAINGSMIALVDALRLMQRKKWIKHDPLQHFIGALSVGIHQGQVVADLDYALDSTADTDLNMIMTDSGQFIEIQGTAEGKPFSESELNQMLLLGKKHIMEIIDLQKQCLGVIACEQH